MTRADLQRRRNAIALAASALVHVTVLGALARYAPVFQPLQPAPRDFQIELVPEAPLAASGQAERVGAALETAPRITPRAPKRAARRTGIQTTTPYPQAARSAPAQTARPPSPRSNLTSQAPPLLPPHFVPGAGAFGTKADGAAGATGGFLEAPEGANGDEYGDGSRLRGALRTSVGCEDPDYYNLSKAERAVCARAFGVQAAIGSRQNVDAINSAQVRNKYEQDRQACERINHYATPLDSDRDHSASAPQVGLNRLHC